MAAAPQAPLVPGARNVARQPPQFEHSKDDFSSWYAVYANFARAMGIAPANQFTTLTTYLDKDAFATVHNLELADAVTADPDQYRPLLEQALARDEDEVPPRLALRYRTQQPGESLSAFSLELQKLAGRAGRNNADDLIDTFCAGVREDSLSLELLRTDFNTLAEALQKAISITNAKRIRSLVRPGTQRTAVPTPDELQILASDSDHVQCDSTPAPAPTTRFESLSTGAHMPQGFGSRSQQPDHRDHSVDAVNYSHSRPESQYNTQQQYNAQPQYGTQPHYSVQPQYGTQPHYSVQPQYSAQYQPDMMQQQMQGYNAPTQSHNRSTYRRPEANYPSQQGQYNGRNNNRGNNSDSRRCYYCNRLGHLIRACKTRMAAERQQQPQNFPMGPSQQQ